MNGTLLSHALEVGVRLEVQRLLDAGGPGEADYQQAREYAGELAAHGDDLLYRSPRKGRSAQLYGMLCRTVAVLAFVPGGIRILGYKYEVKNDQLHISPEQPAG